MDNTPTLPPADETTAPDTPVRKTRLSRRTWILLTAAVLVAGGAAYGIPTAVGAVEHQAAVDRFETVVADRTAAYETQDKAIEQLHTMEDLVTATYPQYLAIGTTLTDTTVTDPALRADLLTKTSELATAALALDETGTLDVERPSLFTVLVPAEDMPLKGLTPPAQTEDVNALTDKLAKDASSVLEYVDLVGDVTDDIIAAMQAVVISVDVAIASAGEKGVTLTWEKAPAETAAVTAAATALTADGATDLPLEERAALVGTYIAAVNTAGAAHQAVLDQEAAEAARQAEEQAQAQQRNNSGSSNGSRGTSNGSRGNSNPGGGTSPGGGTNPGTGGGTPGGSQSNWQPLKLNVTESQCSGGGHEATYGSTLNVPGTQLGSYSTYEIPGYGWGVTWTCKRW